MKIRKKIADLMSLTEYIPLKRAELSHALNLNEEEKQKFNRVLRQMIQDGQVVRLKKKGFILSQAADLLAGTISFTRKDAAFVRNPESGTTVFVPARSTQTALPGDEVLVRINRGARQDEKRRLAEGEVIRILERRRRQVLGILRQARRHYYIEPQHAMIPRPILVSSPAGANPGDRVLVTLLEWDDPLLNPEGEISEIIGPADDPSLDTLAVLRAFDLNPVFPPEIIAEAELVAFPDPLPKDRLDLRDRFVFTIDPASARDFDDAISLEHHPDGSWLLGVHIADVSAMVTPGSALDSEAVRRGTSVYLPDQVVPMLPEQLSNGLCSLSPDVDRLTMSVLIKLDATARVRHASFHNSVIHSRKRLTYEQAFAAICAPDDIPLPDENMSKEIVQTIRLAHQLAQMLRRQRLESDGALNLDIPEVFFDIDEDGRVRDILPRAHNEAHQLIEEFMILANQEVCRHLSKKGVPHLHRIHEPPAPEHLAELEVLFAAAGFRVGDLTDRRNLNQLLRKMAGDPREYAWHMSILRSMKKAAYSPEPIGHYGLAKTFYDHFTSPIRRYPDLLVHRVLKSVIAQAKPPQNRDELLQLGEQCSLREGIALQAEREIIDLKRLRFFSDQLENGNLREYTAVVTRVTNFGVFIDIPMIQAFGMIHVSQLQDDFYDFNEPAQRLTGRRHGRVFALGTDIDVVIAKVDIQRKLLDFVPAHPPQKNDKNDKKKKRKRRSQNQKGRTRKT